ncbi:hypothetical protein BKA66DRAFT_453625 [Pyrenochaeta sp. MPI-SDFR-AT-0127]|nr:hypothetical protein BKA66DRAFT_453625 [Pyrenochaeta sp. MPI-SDFR-AT-0127]
MCLRFWHGGMLYWKRDFFCVGAELCRRESEDQKRETESLVLHKQRQEPHRGASRSCRDYLDQCCLSFCWRCR